MPSTVYKGDLAEVSFAPEVGLTIVSSTDASFALTAGDDHTQIVFTGANSVIFNSDDLRYPDGMLVGSQVVFTRNSGTAIADGDLDRVFTIVYNAGDTIKLAPKMLSSGTINDSAVSLHILPYKTPPLNSAMSRGANSESVLTDQFLGITNALTVPETKVDLKRFHVVGLGRDTSVQVPGKMITEGGSFEVAMHSARWLKYCLGGEVVTNGTDSDVAPTLSAATKAGQSFITVSAATDFDINKHIIIKETATYTPVTTTHDANIADAALRWDGSFTDTRFDTALRSEARHIIGVDGTTIYLDEPLQYPHASGLTVNLRDYADATNKKAPAVNTTTTPPTITNAQTHLLFTNTYQPSFSLEVSQRRRNVDTGEGATDGSATDSKELTRVFRGCKVTDFTLTTDNDAALRLAVNFNAALCYTDTGRLEGTPITRYASHRMFDDTANTTTKRFISGIAPCTQKPFMFYNGTINMAGVQVAQVLNFNLTGQLGMQGFHVINGQNSVSSATEQVPFGGSRNTSLMVEGQTTYEATMEIIVDDPLFYHKMRSATEFSGKKDGNTNNQIRIDFTKSTSQSDTERLMIIIDEYYIVEAPLQIPEDKGAVKSTLKIMPKTIKVVARDTIIKY